MEPSIRRNLPRVPDSMSPPISPARVWSIPPSTTGDIAPSSPFSFPVAPVVVKIGGVSAIVQFGGLAPGFVGLLQLNVLIPDVPAGELSFEASVGGVSDASTVISIAAKQ